MIRWLSKRFWPRLYQAILKWQEDDGLTLAASLGYYGAFSFFPLVFVLLAGAGVLSQYWSYAEEIKQEFIVRWIEQNTSHDLGNQVKQILGGVQTSARSNGPIGLLILILGA